MAENYYYKSSKVTTEDIYTNSRLRNNAFVTITSNDGFRLPVTATTMDTTYNPEGTGRGASILKSVKISLQGEQGSLRRLDASFTCFDKTSFEKAEKALLIPGSVVTVKYGYTGPDRPSQSGEHEFRVYDYSFSLTKENYFECSLKGVGIGTGAEYEVVDIISGNDKFATENLSFITDFDGIDEVTKVQNIFDYIDYQIQVVTGTDVDSAEGRTVEIDLGPFGTLDTGISSANSFNPPHGKCGAMPDGGHYGILKAPDEYNPTNRIDGGLFEPARISYITLEALVAIVNKYSLAGNTNNYQIKFDKAFSAIDLIFDAGRIWSPSPHKVLFPYAKDTPENSYTPSTGETDPEKFISCNSFAENNLDAYNTFRLDNSTNGSPKGILLSRDVIRELQKSFDDKAANEDKKTEDTEKAGAKIDLGEFFKKIFGIIRDNSGGDWNLTLETSEDNLDSDGNEVPVGTIWIVNKKSPVKDSVTELVLSPASGKNGVREFKLSGQVPSDIQAQAFGGAPSLEKTAADIIAENQAALTEAEAEYELAVERLQTELPAARSKINDMSYALDASTAAKGLIKELVETLKPNDMAIKNKLLEPTPYPLSLSIAIDGTEGFRFGDTITSDYLPARYRPKNGARVVFTVTEYTHTIKGNDWQTDLTTISRITMD
jgi:hypothetical protein